MEDKGGSILLKLLSPFSYQQKFIFISCLFGLSILVSSYFMLASQNKLINFVEKELEGIQYLQPLKGLMQKLPKHKLTASRIHAGEKALKSNLVGLDSEIGSDFNALITTDQELEIPFATTPSEFQKRGLGNLKPEELKHRWSTLAQQLAGMSTTTSDKEHDALTRDLKVLAIHIADTSNLSVDPELDTHYLIEGGPIKTLELQELLSQVSSLGEGIIQRKEITAAEKASLIGLIALMRSKLDQSQTDLQKLFNYEKILRNDVETESKLKDASDQYYNASLALIDFVEKNLLGAKEIASDETSFISLSSKARETSWNFLDASMDQLTHLLQLRLHSFKLQQRISSLLCLLAALAGFLLGFLIMRGISRPLTNLVTAAKHLAGGDLSTRVPVLYEDEVGQVGVAFNQMAESFQELIGQLQWTGIQLTTSTTEIAATAKQQEATIVEQEATTKEIAATAREISATAKEFAKTMSEVSSGAEQTSSLASSGKTGLNRMETIMRQMVDAAGNIASKLAVLNEKAGSITSIVTTIGKVADQTNLLSLNAAIEAEKAGEYGRSFAVIAREIRRLADQTANATLDIEKMVNEMVSAVSAGVMGVDKFSEEINTGVKQASNVGEQLSKIIEQVQQQTASFETVNQGMQAQSQGAEQINESINQLSEAAMQTTESIRQFHNAIEQLNNAAQEMQNAVSRIKR